MEPLPETSPRSGQLDQDQQTRILQECEGLSPTLEAAGQMRTHLRSEGIGLVLLGQLVRARTVSREKLSQVPFERGQEAVNLALALQGQMKGFDLAIDLIFELANYTEETTE